MANISKIFKGRIYTIIFVDDYSSITLKSKRREAQEETEPEPSKAKSKRKELPLKLYKEFINKIKTDRKI